MAADLPKEFDVIVLGTGMPESIVAAAFSRIGQSVLHLDRNQHYSGDWTSFNFQGIQKWANEQQDGCEGGDRLTRPSVDEGSLLEEGETLIPLPLYKSHFSQVQASFHICEDDSDDEKKKIDKPDIANPQSTEACEDQSKTSESDDSTKTEGVLEGSITTTETCDKSDSESSKSKSEESYSTEKLEPNPGTTENEEKVEQKVTDTIHELEEKVSQVSTESSSGALDADAGQGKEENAAQQSNVETGTLKKACKKWTMKRMNSEWRQYNLDLSPKVVYSGGDMVELLISSDIAKYCEFKTVTQILTLLNGVLEKVPCSRADVFSSKKVTMLEKRMLMKFMQFCVEYENKMEEVREYLDKPFKEFLASKKLTPNIQHYIQHSIAMANDSMSTKQALLQMKKFLKSLGRYGNTAFLWSLYGSGELPQSYCRMCAVFGGTYVLNMSASSVIVDTTENKCKGIVTTDGQRITCKWLIMESSYAPEQYLSQANDSFISRAIILTDKPLLPTAQHELSLMVLPCPDDGDRPVFVLELPPSSMAAPQGIYVFHLTRRSVNNIKPEDDLAYAVNNLFSTGSSEGETVSRPAILWSLYYTQLDMSQPQNGDQLPVNIVLMSGPGAEVDIDRPVQEAREVFKKILPEEEFLPKAPNPEDIIYVDDNETQVNDGNSHSEYKDAEDDKSDSVTEIEAQASSQSEDGIPGGGQSEPGTEIPADENEAQVTSQSEKSVSGGDQSEPTTEIP